MDYSGAIPSWNEIAQYRYDISYNGASVVDAVIVSDDLSDILVMERLDNDVIGPDTYEVLIYSINLENQVFGFNSSNYDISNCTQLNDNCINGNKIISKTLQFNLTDWQKNNQGSGSVVSYASVIPIDAFTIVPTDTQNICNSNSNDYNYSNGSMTSNDSYSYSTNNEKLLIAFSDNDEAFDTYILYFCYNSTSIHSVYSEIENKDAYWGRIDKNITYHDMCPYSDDIGISTKSIELDMALLCIIAAFVIVICAFHARAVYSNNRLFRASAVRRFAIYSLDFISDIFFIVQVQLYIDFKHFGQNLGHNEVIFLLSTLFVILPTLASILQLKKAIETWSSDPYMRTIIQEWYVCVNYNTCFSLV